MQNEHPRAPNCVYLRMPDKRTMISLFKSPPMSEEKLPKSMNFAKQRAWIITLHEPERRGAVRNEKSMLGEDRFMRHGKGTLSGRAREPKTARLLGVLNARFATWAHPICSDLHLFLLFFPQLFFSARTILRSASSNSCFFSSPSLCLCLCLSLSFMTISCFHLCLSLS